MCKRFEITSETAYCNSNALCKCHTQGIGVLACVDDMLTS
jgi:hypothetical protein